MKKCEHDWRFAESYNSEYAKGNDLIREEIGVFYCTKCLEIRHKSIKTTRLKGFMKSMDNYLEMIRGSHV